MRVFHISTADAGYGGAGNAARDICNLVERVHEVRMVVERSMRSTEGVKPWRWMRELRSKVRGFVGRLLIRIAGYSEKPYRSISLLPSGMDRVMNEFAPDIIHLHWIQSEMVSIEEIGRIKGRVIWTLHDWWPVCGAEHVLTSGNMEKIFNGYAKGEAELGTMSFDIDRWCWQRKKKAWNSSWIIVTPSTWMTWTVQNSDLLGENDVRTIGNPIDTEYLKPRMDSCNEQKQKRYAAEILFLTGRDRGTNKLGNELDIVISLLCARKERSRIRVGGCSYSSVEHYGSCDVEYLKYTSNSDELRRLYQTADVIAVPSRMESFGLVAAEALSCGLPVVCYDVGGLKDIVVDGKCGIRCKGYDEISFSKSVVELGMSLNKRREFGMNGRRHIVENYDKKVISEKYIGLYEYLSRVEL